MNFSNITEGINAGLKSWEPELQALSETTICDKRNGQGRTIKQILGHMVDSVSNNTHRIVHLQYQASPMQFPNYATDGNNDRWIAIQNYQDENWDDLVQLWKYSHLHLIHVIKQVNPDKLENEWIAGGDDLVKLREMITDFLRHFQLHLNEVRELINQ